MLATTVPYLHVHVCMPYLLLCAFSGKEIEQFPARKREKHSLTVIETNCIQNYTTSPSSGSRCETRPSLEFRQWQKPKAGLINAE